MPSTGMPSSSSSVRSRGASGAYTDAGPPDRISPRGERRLISSRSTVCGSSSLNTPHSRTRRAINCEYWPPKSSTSTSSARVAAAPAAGGRGGVNVSDKRLLPARGGLGEAAAVRHVVRGRRRRGGRGGRAHADLLRLLELLALGLQRRRDHDLRAVERGDVLVAAGGHRRAQAAHQVEGAVVLVRGAEQDLLERAVLGGLHARATRERGVEGGHAPGEAAAGRLVGAGERGADHHGVGAAGERL